MNVFQYTEALDALLVAHKAGLISNENLTLGTALVVELFNAQPEGAKTGVKLDSPRFFAAYTAEQFVASPAFLAIALPDAIRLIAKTNGATAEDVALAFNAGMPTVVNQAAKLIAKAARHCADEANACRLYAGKPVAVILGRAAYIEGASLDHCNPFVEGSALAVEWAQGWREAQDEHYQAAGVVECIGLDVTYKDGSSGFYQAGEGYTVELDGGRYTIFSHRGGPAFSYEPGHGCVTVVTVRRQ